MSMQIKRDDDMHSEQGSDIDEEEVNEPLFYAHLDSEVEEHESDDDDSGIDW